MRKRRLAEEKQRTKQAEEETARIRSLERIIDTETATTRQALSLARYALAGSNRAVARLHAEPEKYRDIIHELEAEQEREKEIKKVEQYLKVLDPRSVARLSSRVRPMVTEMGLPLRKEVKSFTIGAANDDKPLAYFDRQRVESIESKCVEEEPMVLECRIRGYDRDAAVGKLSSEHFVRVLNFIVPPDRKLELQPKILRAMHDSVDTVYCEFLRLVDQSQQPTSLILMDVRHQVEPEEAAEES